MIDKKGTVFIDGSELHSVLVERKRVTLNLKNGRMEIIPTR